MRSGGEESGIAVFIELSAIFFLCFQTQIMAIDVSFDNRDVTCILHACSFTGKCETEVGATKKLFQLFDPNRITPLACLALFHIMGQKSKVGNILRKYKNAITAAPGLPADERMTLLEIAILDGSKADNLSRICSACESEYIADTRPFEKVLFVKPDVEKCVDHCVQNHK